MSNLTEQPEFIEFIPFEEINVAEYRETSKKWQKPKSRKQRGNRVLRFTFALLLLAVTTGAVYGAKLAIAWSQEQVNNHLIGGGPHGCFGCKGVYEKWNTD